MHDPQIVHPARMHIDIREILMVYNKIKGCANQIKNERNPARIFVAVYFTL